MGGERLRRQAKRRGEDPRLDALAMELASEEEGEGGEARARKEAPALIMAGGVDAAKVHVAGLDVPHGIEPTTRPSRKVVIGAATGGGRGEEAAALGEKMGWAKWRTAAIVGAGIALASASVGVTMWAMKGRKAGNGEAGAMREEIRSEAAMAEPAAMRGGPAAPSMDVAPGSFAESSGAGQDCAVSCFPPTAVSSPISPSSVPQKAAPKEVLTVFGGAQPSGAKSASPSSTGAPDGVQTAPAASGAPVPVTSPLEF